MNIPGSIKDCFLYIFQFQAADALYKNLLCRTVPAVHPPIQLYLMRLLRPTADCSIIGWVGLSTPAGFFTPCATAAPAHCWCEWAKQTQPWIVGSLFNGIAPFSVQNHREEKISGIVSRCSLCSSISYHRLYKMSTVRP